jgi:hypothetical protein
MNTVWPIENTGGGEKSVEEEENKKQEEEEMESKTPMNREEA